MKKFFLRCSLALALLAASFLLPRVSRAAGNDNPTGPTGEYNGSISTAGSYDPYTGNAKRFVEDLTVTGSVGAYPLKWTRILNTRQGSTAGFGQGGAWTHSYRWALWVRGYQPYEYHDEQYDLESPDGGVTYPDGRTMELEVTEEGLYFQKRGVEPLGRIQNMPGGNYDLILPDGGRVKFEHLPGTSGGYSLVATRIVDPHGQTTTFAHDSAGRLSRITEPGGRYLQINYTTFSYPSPLSPGGIAHVDVISSVQAFASAGNLTETVNYSYTYETVDGYRSYNLTQVNYDDNTQATYTYYTNSGPAGLSGGRMNTCRDVRYAGAMKNIKYEYAAWSATHRVAVGQVQREKNLTTGQVVSEVTYPPTHPESNDPSRYVRTETRGDGKTRSFQYSNDGHAELQSYTDFKNQRSYLGYGSASGGINYLRVFTDARGHKTSTEKERVAGAVMAVFHHDGPPIRYTYSDPLNPYYLASKRDERGYDTTYTRDPVNHRITQTNYPDQGYETFTYNQFGQVLTHRMTSGGTESFGYDGRGLKRSYTDPLGNVTQYNYYQSWPHTDRLLNVIDPHGNATWFEYNLRGQVTKLMHQDATYTQSGYNPDGTLAWTADENHPNASWNVNERTRYTYDEYKRVLTVTNPMNETTTNSYAIDVNWAQPLLHTTNSLKYTNSPMGKNVVFDYDANFRKTSQVSALGTPDEAWTLFEYDAVGNLTKTTDPRFNVTTFGYDSRNRQTSVKNALNQTTLIEYDDAGNKRKETRPDGAFRSWDYDSMNRLWHAVDWRMSEAEPAQITTYGRNATATVETITDPKGAVYTFTFDALHRKTSATYPPDVRSVPRTETWHYNAAGHMVEYKNRAGARRVFAPYDNRNWPTSFSWHNEAPGQSTQGQSFAYDAVGNIKGLQNAEANLDFTYDAANRKTSETQTIKSYGLNQIHTVTYEYDADGNRSRFVYPQGWDYRYAYTNRNQLASIRLASSGTPSVQYAYDVAGNRSRRTIYYGAYTDYSHNALNQLYSQTSYFNGSTARFDYGFDAANRIKYEQRDSGAADGFSYDARNELTGFNQNGTLNANGTVSAAYNLSISYDANGNRVDASDGGNAHYERAPNNQYSSDWTGALNYDDNANLVTRAGWTFTYDAQNRLVKIQSGSTVIHYHYDPLNRIVARRAPNGAITTQVWDDWKLIEEREANDVFRRMYFHGAATNEIVAAYGPAYGDAFYFQDGRGNVTHLTGPGNNVIERYTYFVSGQPNYLSGNSMHNRFLFQGAMFVPEAEIYDMRNRFYHPNLGRFMQSDPIGFQIQGAKLTAEQRAFFSPGGVAPEAFSSSELNLYRYCGNDPVNKIDPMGLDFTDDLPARPVDKIDKQHVGQTFAATDVKIVEQQDGTFTLRLDVTIVDRTVADKIFFHGRWMIRTEAQKAATRQHEEIEHSKDWEGFHDTMQKEVPSTRFSSRDAAKATAKPLQTRLRGEARKANKEFEKHQPNSRWKEIRDRERP